MNKEPREIYSKFVRIIITKFPFLKKNKTFHLNYYYYFVLHGSKVRETPRSTIVSSNWIFNSRFLTHSWNVHDNDGL